METVQVSGRRATSRMMMAIRFRMVWGISRRVFLIGRYAIKFPRVWCWRYFLVGLLANMMERDTWSDFRDFYAKDQVLCPVLWCMPGGWMLVMRRADPVPEGLLADDWADRFKEHHFSDLKEDNLGMVDGQIVLVDYG